MFERLRRKNRETVPPSPLQVEELDPTQYISRTKVLDWINRSRNRINQAQQGLGEEQPGLFSDNSRDSDKIGQAAAVAGARELVDDLEQFITTDQSPGNQAPAA